jgi:hypothetical protein
MLLLSSFAFAYELHMFGFADPTDIKYAYRKDGIYDYSYNISEAKSAWNATNTPIFLSQISNILDANLRIYSNSYGNVGWHGLWNFQSYSVSMININDYYYSNFVNNKSELAAHEIGHAFGLKDVANTTVLMRNSGYKGSHYPEQDDINGINANY